MQLSIKQSVILSFLWSLSNELCIDRVVEVKDKNGKTKTMKMRTTKRAPNDFRIACHAECLRLDDEMTDHVESLKMVVWDKMAEQYEGQELTADIITMIEALYFENFDWLQKINPNFEHWVNSMSMKMIDIKIDPKFSRKVATQFVQTLNKVLYDGNKN